MSDDRRKSRRQQTGRTIMVTGGTGGIGYQTARMLARGGARLIITGRSADTGERAAATIRQESGGEVGHVHTGRPCHRSGNQDLAEQVSGALPRLDVLVNNVGGLYPTRWPQAAIVGAAGSNVLLLLTFTPWWLLALAIAIAIVVLSWRTLSR